MKNILVSSGSTCMTRVRSSIQIRYNVKAFSRHIDKQNKLTRIYNIR